MKNGRETGCPGYACKCPGLLSLHEGPTTQCPAAPQTTGIFGLAAASACGSKSWFSFWVIFSLVRLPSENLVIPLPVTSKVRHPPPSVVPQPPGWADASSTRGLGTQNKALLRWCPPAHHCCQVLRHLRGWVMRWGPGAGPPSFSVECCSLALRGQRASHSFSHPPGSPPPPGPHPPVGLGGP